MNKAIAFYSWDDFDSGHGLEETAWGFAILSVKTASVKSSRTCG